MQLTDLKARIHRLEALSRGLAKEVELWREVDLLLYRERRAYLAGVQDALSGVELARVTLAAAIHRLEGER